MLSRSQPPAPIRVRRPRSRYAVLRVLLPLFLFLFGCFTPEPPPGPTADNAYIAILGEAYRLAPGSAANFLVQVRDPYAGKAEPDRNVTVALASSDHGNPQQVYSGKTGADGLVHVSFEVPATIAAPDQVLEITAETSNGEQTVYQDVYAGRVYNVLASTDKPVYQPGQVIHIRGLAFDALDMHAADSMTMTVTVADPQGNKLLHKELLTSKFGIASADFTLDSQAPSGDYIITTQMGPTSSTRSVEVKPYSLPRFEIKFQPDKTFYLPGETATGKVEARYFFGKPVVGGQVTIHATTDVAGEVSLFELTGVTDQDGVFAYKATIPDYFAGQLDNKKAQIDLEIQVVDTANHSEKIDDNITVAEKALLIDAVPESGMLRPGLENLVYLDVSYPDGVAARAALTVTDRVSNTYTAVTDAYGLAVITMTTQSPNLVPLEVLAVDQKGNRVTQPLLLGTEGDAGMAVLLRPDKSEYKIGDTANIDIYTSAGVPSVYLDIIKDRQTFGLVNLPVKDGKAQAAIPIDGSLLGTIELNAYVTDRQGQLTADHRLVLVNPAPADVSVSTNAKVYRPGDTATLDLQVLRDGKAMPGAIGISIVDESVFAVENQDPGFARTYFLLQRDLQEPRFEIHDFAKLDDDVYSPYDDAPANIRYASDAARIAHESARQVALSGAFAKELASQHAVAPGNAAHPPAPVAPLAFFWGNRLYLIAPLVGIALYDGSRKRRKILIGLVLFSLAAFFWSACAASAPAAAPAAPAAESVATTSTTATRGQQPRLRQFFPETLYWMPELQTDDQGRAQVDVPIADSITTWRVSVVASDQAGNLGSAEVPLRVFQDFFVEPDMPRFLTVDDELQAPVSIYNYLNEPQTVTLAVQPADWFEFTGEPNITVDLGPNAVSVAYLPIRVKQAGQHDFQVTATGSKMSDAVVRTVEVVPNGKQTVTVDNGKLRPAQTFPVAVPATAITGTGQVTLKVYPGVISEIVAGLEGMLQEPYGCFEQTSSATYPNVMILNYLKTTEQANPRIQLRAEALINQGYQRLLTFEVPNQPGGFSLFGDPPAEMMLTAYGLMEFSDMGHVAYVDPQLMARVVSYLDGQQNSDGSWQPAGQTIESGMGSVDSELAATAYIAWGMADAGYADDPAVTAALRYLQRRMQSARGAGSAPPSSATSTASPLRVPPAELDNYTLALIANAYVAGGKDATPILDVLLEKLQRDADQVHWGSNTVTYLGSYGDPVDLETTAMVAQALLRTGYAPEVANQALNYLLAHRDALGRYYTTQTTVQVLKALTLAAQLAKQGGNATVTVTLTGPDGIASTQMITVDDSMGDVVQQVTFDNVAGDNQLAVTVDGDRQLPYQLLTQYYTPWATVAQPAQAQQPMRVEVRYDRTDVAVNDIVSAQAKVELLTPGTAGTVIVDLGIPPGFSPMTADLDKLVATKAIDRYELTGQQIILYLTNVKSGQEYTFDYRLQARFPMRAQTPPSQAYDYYAPEQNATEAPQRITVTLNTPQP